MNKTLVLIGGLIMFTVSIAAFVTMSALHLDTGPLIAFLGVAWGALGGAGGIAAWRNTEVIKEQTNGPLSTNNLNTAETMKAVNLLTAHIREIDERLTKVNV